VTLKQIGKSFKKHLMMLLIRTFLKYLQNPKLIFLGLMIPLERKRKKEMFATELDQ